MTKAELVERVANQINLTKKTDRGCGKYCIFKYYRIVGGWKKSRIERVWQFPNPAKKCKDWAQSEIRTKSGGSF